MSKVRNLPEATSLADNDLLYVVDVSEAPNGGKKVTKANLKASVVQTPAEIKTAYESNANTNAYTDAEKALVATVSNKLNKTGDTMSGDLDMDGNNVMNVNLVDGVDVSDHAARHNPGGADAIATAAAVTISTSSVNAQGTAAAFARADHVHNVTIAYQIVTATTDDTTTSTTDTLIAGMTLTPAAGTYLVNFSTTVLNSANGATRLFVSIWSGGAQVPHSERNIGINAANTAVHTSAVVTVNGTQAIEARWRAVAGTNTAHQRSLTILRIG
jgi:hypothetical protein